MHRSRRDWSSRSTIQASGTGSVRSRHLVEQARLVSQWPTVLAAVREDPEYFATRLHAPAIRAEICSGMLASIDWSRITSVSQFYRSICPAVGADSTAQRVMNRRYELPSGRTVWAAPQGGCTQGGVSADWSATKERKIQAVSCEYYLQTMLCKCNIQTQDC